MCKSDMEELGYKDFETKTSQKKGRKKVSPEKGESAEG